MSELSTEQLKEFFQEYKTTDINGNEIINEESLRKLFNTLGENPTDAQLREIIADGDTDGNGTISFSEFQAVLGSHKGDRRTKLTLAFSIFDKDQNGTISAAELHAVMGKFGLSLDEIKDMIATVETNGDGTIDFEEFCKLVPEEKASAPAPAPAPAHAPAPVPAHAPDVAAPSAGAAAHIDLLHEEREPDSAPPVLVNYAGAWEGKQGTSRLELQIAMFRLIQGAAYRSFRENFSANAHTHLRVRALPYTITNFVSFTKVAIDFYKGLGIVDSEIFPLLDAVVVSLENQYAQLKERIANWKNIEKTPEMLAEDSAMKKGQRKTKSLTEKFLAGVEYAISMKKQKISLFDVIEGLQASKEIKRLANQELSEIFSGASANAEKTDPKLYLKKWNRVIIENEDEIIEGAMMPAAYWYEDFMPKLLAAFSCGTKADIKMNVVPNEKALDAWFVRTDATGTFNKFGKDVQEGFLKCSPAQKLAVKQAWHLTHWYLNGIQKKRERSEFGRDDGVLSHYVTFIDVYLNQSTIKNAEMRISFPYFIGCEVWRFFHTSAELVCVKPPEAQPILIDIFKKFFKNFATMYPCPYCRHHLNMFVIRNSEIDMYPLEYILLGRNPDQTDFAVNIDAKLATVVDGPTLRLFFWKLHNTVSSSIERTEAWYHKDARALYTTRFWPSLPSELTKAQIYKKEKIPVKLVSNLYGLNEWLSKLGGLRQEFQEALDTHQGESSELNALQIRKVCLTAVPKIRELEEEVLKGKYLQETYRFNPDLVHRPPRIITEEDEAWARSGKFLAF